MQPSLACTWLNNGDLTSNEVRTYGPLETKALVQYYADLE